MITEQNINIPIYDFRVHVIVCDSMDEVPRRYKPYIETNMIGCTLEYPNCCRCTLIITPNDYGTIVHELEHVKNLIWKAKGYTPHADNDEPDAYLIGWLFTKVDKIIKKHLNEKENRKS